MLSLKHWHEADSVCIPYSTWMHHSSDLHPLCSRLILIPVSGLWAVRCSQQIKPINLCKCEYLCLPSELSAAPGLVQTLWDLSLGAKSAGIPSVWWGRGSDWLAQDQVCLQDEPVVPGTKGRRGSDENIFLKYKMFCRNLLQGPGPLHWLAGSIADPASCVTKIASSQSNSIYISCFIRSRM